MKCYLGLIQNLMLDLQILYISKLKEQSNEITNVLEKEMKDQLIWWCC